ncbi:hypothetical protein GGG16DRAFT_93155 [Schizophyllum commune]
MVGLQGLPFKRTHTDDVLRQSSRSSSDDPKSADDEEKVTVPTVSKHGAVNSEGKDDGDRSLLEQDEGVTRIEALYLVFGKGWALWGLWLSIGLIFYVYTLSSGTTYTYLSYATSSYLEHTLIGTISVATAIIAAVSKPFLAKLADLTSRPTALALSVLLYTVGYIVVASSTSVNAVAAGEVIYTPGSTGLDFLTGILVADITSLQWRSFVTSALGSTPWLINEFISTYITTGISANTTNGWRWGFGMFAILIPVCITPALAVLFWGDRKAKKLGALSVAASGYVQRKHLEGRDDEASPSKLHLALHYWRLIDGFGLCLIGTVFAMLLIPFTLSTTASKGFKNPSLIAMFCVGGVLLIVLVLWEWKFASHPIMPKRIINRSLVCSIIIDFFYYLSGYISGTYFLSWVYIIKNDWTLSGYTYYSYTETLTLCFFGIIAGAIQRVTHRYKYLQLSGLCIRAIGQGIQLYAIKNPSTVVLVMAQVISCLGGSFSVVGSQVAVQASVPHQDMALAAAILSLWTGIGGGIGSAISASVWNDNVPANLAKYIGDTHNATEIADIFGSIIIARDTEPHDLVVKAYGDSIRPLFIAALVLSIVPILAGFYTTNFYLGTQHNAIEAKEVKILSADETTEEAIREKARRAEEALREKEALKDKDAKVAVEEKAT